MCISFAPRGFIRSGSFISMRPTCPLTETSMTSGCGNFVRSTRPWNSSGMGYLSEIGVCVALEVGRKLAEVSDAGYAPRTDPTERGGRAVQGIAGRVQSAMPNLANGRDLGWLLDLRPKPRPAPPFLIWEPFEGPGRSWTYSEFVAEVDRVATGMRRREIGRG